MSTTTTQPDPKDKLVWTYEDLQILTGISRKELGRMVDRGELPKPKKRGKLRLFMPDAVRKAIAELPEAGS